MATLDSLSGGRVILGAAAGYLKSEFRALGVDFDERNELFDEALEVLALTWAGEPVTYQGRHFSAAGNQLVPVPVQQPPPVWIGGNSAAARRRAAALRPGLDALRQPPPGQPGRAHAVDLDRRRPRPAARRADRPGPETPDGTPSTSTSGSPAAAPRARTTSTRATIGIRSRPCEGIGVTWIGAGAVGDDLPVGPGGHRGLRPRGHRGGGAHSTASWRATDRRDGGRSPGPRLGHHDQHHEADQHASPDGHDGVRRRRRSDRRRPTGRPRPATIAERHAERADHGRERDGVPVPDPADPSAVAAQGSQDGEVPLPRWRRVDDHQIGQAEQERGRRGARRSRTGPTGPGRRLMITLVSPGPDRQAGRLGRGGRTVSLGAPGRKSMAMDAQARPPGRGPAETGGVTRPPSPRPSPPSTLGNDGETRRRARSWSPLGPRDGEVVTDPDVRGRGRRSARGRSRRRPRGAPSRTRERRARPAPARMPVTSRAVVPDADPDVAHAGSAPATSGSSSRMVTTSSLIVAAALPDARVEGRAPRGRVVEEVVQAGREGRCGDEGDDDEQQADRPAC